jgi:hypothetical protein
MKSNQGNPLRHAARLSLATCVLLLACLPAWGQSHYRALNEPPTLHYLLDTDVAPSFSVYKEISINRKPSTIIGSLNWVAADSDSGNGAVTLHVELVGGQNIVTIALAELDGVEIIEPGRSYVMTAPIDAVAAALWSLAYKATADADVDIYITLNDNGFTGACSKTNTSPCARAAVAHMLIHFKAPVP